VRNTNVWNLHVREVLLLLLLLLLSFRLYAYEPLPQAEDTGLQKSQAEGDSRKLVEEMCVFAP